jgi:acetate kinase
MGTTLVVNPGSSSKKYALYKEGHAILELSFESSDAGYEVCTQKQSTRQLCESITQADFQIAFARVAATVKQYLDAEKITLDSISVRVVAPGTVFQRHTVIDDAYAALLRSKELSAPLHIPNILKEIQSCHEHFAGVRIIAASDSAFHASLPFVAREFSLQRDSSVWFSWLVGSLGSQSCSFCDREGIRTTCHLSYRKRRQRHRSKKRKKCRYHNGLLSRKWNPDGEPRQ